MVKHEQETNQKQRPAKRTTAMLFQSMTKYTLSIGRQRGEELFSNFLILWKKHCVWCDWELISKISFYQNNAHNVQSWGVLLYLAPRIKYFWYQNFCVYACGRKAASLMYDVTDSLLDWTQRIFFLFIFFLFFNFISFSIWCIFLFSSFIFFMFIMQNRRKKSRYW